jgi:hypothetical protein
MADGLGWFVALKPDGLPKSSLMLNAYVLATFREMWSMPSPGWFGALYPRPDGIAYSLVECSEWLMEDYCFTGQTHLSQLLGSKALIAPGGESEP